jgi:hypothetical protein
MIREFRHRYNAAFTQARYDAYIHDINTSQRAPMDFHLCETPLFISAEMHRRLMAATHEIIDQINTPEYMARSAAAIRPDLAVPNPTPHPEFVQLDFALCDDGHGGYVPKLIELQGFPSLYAFQWRLDQKTRQHFDLDPALRFYIEPYDETRYIDLFKHTVLNGHAPENTILLELFPDQQKTRIDFACTELLTGIQTVCLTKVIRRGEKLFYKHPERGYEVPITRIYSRVIFDDLCQQTGLDLQFTMREAVDVSWAGHPCWFFQISKYSLPLLHGDSVPVSYFVSDLPAELPNLQDYVLKPLFSYSGAGVELDPTPEKLAAIPAERRGEFILQRKVEYAPLVETPDGMAKAEVRILMLWPLGTPTPIPVCNLVRMSKGRMMGTRFNKDRTWVGSTLGYYLPS